MKRGQPPKVGSKQSYWWAWGAVQLHTLRMHPRERMVATLRVLDGQVAPWSIEGDGHVTPSHPIFKRIVKLGLIEVTRKPNGMPQVDSNKRNHWRPTPKGYLFLATGCMTLQKPAPKSERQEKIGRHV